MALRLSSHQKERERVKGHGVWRAKSRKKLENEGRRKEVTPG